MRTTITLDDEAVKAIDDLRRETGAGISQAVNTLIHRGASPRRVDYAYPEATFDLGARLPLDRTGELLDLLDADERR